MCAGQDTSVCGIANPEATYWANNTIANSSDKSEHADETIEDMQDSQLELHDSTVDEPMNPEESLPMQTKSLKKSRMVTRGQKRLGFMSKRESMKLRSSEAKKTKTESRLPLTVSRRSKAIHKGSVSAAGQHTYNKQFQFFYSRSCFRGYVEFYKDSLTDMKGQQRTPKQILQNISWRDMRAMIEQLLANELGLADVLSGKYGTQDEVTLLVVTMMMVLFTHRHQKKDTFIVQADKLVSQLSNKSLHK